MKKVKHFLITLAVLSIIVLPLFSMAQELVPCGTSVNTNECGLKDIFTLITNVVHFILFNMAIPIAAIAFAYAGFLLMTSGGETTKLEKAKSIFTNVAIGLVFVAAAWLIVKTILTTLNYDTSWNWFGF